MKKLIISLVITVPLTAVPYRIRLTKCNTLNGHQQRSFSSAVVKEILASVKPPQAEKFEKYLKYEQMIFQERGILNQLLEKKIRLEEELKKSPELREPYKRYTTIVQEYFNNLTQSMLVPTKRNHYQFSHDPTDDDQEKKRLNDLAQTINTEMDNFKDTFVKECLKQLT